MVIQTNEKEFKGKTLQEYLNWKYPTKEDKEGVREIYINEIISQRESQGITETLKGGELDLRKFKNMERMNVCVCNLTKLNISSLVNLEELSCANNNLTSIDFLNTLPNPEKLERLFIFNNNIQPTDISFFSKFINLEELQIGTMEEGLSTGKHNQFYGSLKSYQNLTKLRDICIEATDVNEGLEYLSESLAKSTKRGKFNSIECSPHNTNAKCKAIQDQLRPFNYDLEAWQLINKKHPNLTKQIQELSQKITETKTELETTKTQEADKTAKIQRLETKLNLLKQTKTRLETELTETKQQHHNQLAEIVKFIFPSNSDIRNINFSDLKKEAEKIKTKNQDLKLALSEEQKENRELKKQLTDKELEITRLKEQLNSENEAKIEVNY